MPAVKVGDCSAYDTGGHLARNGRLVRAWPPSGQRRTAPLPNQGPRPRRHRASRHHAVVPTRPRGCERRAAPRRRSRPAGARIRTRGRPSLVIAPTTSRSTCPMSTKFGIALGPSYWYIERPQVGVARGGRRRYVQDKDAHQDPPDTVVARARKGIGDVPKLRGRKGRDMGVHVGEALACLHALKTNSGSSQLEVPMTKARPLDRNRGSSATSFGHWRVIE